MNNPCKFKIDEFYIVKLPDSYHPNYWNNVVYIVNKIINNDYIQVTILLNSNENVSKNYLVGTIHQISTSSALADYSESLEYKSIS